MDSVSGVDAFCALSLESRKEAIARAREEL
jgi:hypothetical protein